MAKPVAPLLSFDARGTIAKTQVYSRWRGQSYVRRYQIPSNPQSVEQTKTRSAFSWLNAVYKVAPTQILDVWQAAARGKPLTDRNAFIKANLPFLRGETDLVNFVFSGGALGGIPPLSMTVTPGNNQLTVDVVAPSVLPSGWTIAKAVVAAIPDQDPQTDADYNITAGEDSTSTYQVVLALADATLYQVGAWFVYNRPDGSLAYSASLRDDGLTT